MRAVKWLGASVVGLVAGILGLVGLILSVTIILLPLGIPVLMLAKKLYGLAAAMVVPRSVRHPFDELGKKGAKAQGDAGDKVSKAGKNARDKAGKAGKSMSGGGRTWYGKKKKSVWAKAFDWVTS